MLQKLSDWLCSGGCDQLDRLADRFLAPFLLCGLLALFLTVLDLLGGRVVCLSVGFALVGLAIRYFLRGFR